MSQNKTQPTSVTVKLFLDGIVEEEKRVDSGGYTSLWNVLRELKVKCGGTSIVGFGEFHYKYKTGRERDWFIMVFNHVKMHSLFI